MDINIKFLINTLLGISGMIKRDNRQTNNSIPSVLNEVAKSRVKDREITLTFFSRKHKNNALKNKITLTMDRDSTCSPLHHAMVKGDTAEKRPNIYASFLFLNIFFIVLDRIVIPKAQKKD